MEPNKAANKLLELLYLQNLDQKGFNDLDLPNKNEAIALLIEQGLVFEDEINLPDNIYTYYDLTPAGEQAYESDGFIATGNDTNDNATLIKVGLAVGVFGAVIVLIFFFMSSK